MYRRCNCPSSFCSSSSAPTRRMTAGSFGKIPTTSVRRLISALSRSSGLVLWKALVRIRYHQLHTAQAPSGQRAQKVRPERLCFAWAHRHAEHFSYAIAVHGDGDYYRLGDDAAGFTRLHVGRVDPQIRPIPFDRAVEECMHPLIDLAAQAADLALGNPAHAHRLDQLVHRTGRDALDVSLLDHGRERLLARPARLQKAREVTS